MKNMKKGWIVEYLGTYSQWHKTKFFTESEARDYFERVGKAYTVKMYEENNPHTGETIAHKGLFAKRQAL